MLLPQQLENLKSIFAQRSAMRPVKSWLPAQTPARPDQILELQSRGNNDYYFRPVSPEKKIISHIPHGLFLFVIPAVSPGKIYCGVSYDSNAAISRLIEPVVGHTSLCEGEDVLFAGEIVFQHGRMISWSNNSGHYMPSVDLIYTNLIPAVRFMLPMNKFVEMM